MVIARCERRLTQQLQLQLPESHGVVCFPARQNKQTAEAATPRVIIFLGRQFYTAACACGSAFDFSSETVELSLQWTQVLLRFLDFTARFWRSQRFLPQIPQEKATNPPNFAHYEQEHLDLGSSPLPACFAKSEERGSSDPDSNGRHPRQRPPPRPPTSRHATPPPPPPPLFAKFIV